MNNLIFGYTWEEIQRKQQGGSWSITLPRIHKGNMREHIMSDMLRWHIPVFKEVAEGYNI